MNRIKNIPENTFERVTRLLGLYVLAPLLLFMSLAMAVQISQKPYWGMQVRHLRVVSIAKGGPAARADVQIGDQIVGFGGEMIGSMADFFSAQVSHYEPDPCSVAIMRAGMLVPTEITPSRPPRSRMIWSYSLWLTGLAFLLMGLWVLSRRNDPVARNFFVLAMIFAFFLAEIPDYPSSLYMTGKEVIRDLLVLLLPAFFLRFLMHFPSQGILTSKQKNWHRLILLPVVPLFLLSLVAQATGIDPATSSLVSFLQYGVFLYFTVYFVAGLVAFARKTLRRDRPIQHTKMRVVLFGLLGGLAPFLVALFLGNFYPESPLPHWEWLGFSLILVPLSLGLAILRYGALDTAFVIRYSLTYGALTLLVIMTYIIVVGILGHLMTRHMQFSPYPLSMITIAGSALAVMPARRMVQGWIDRAFYPTRRSDRAAILALAQDLAGMIDSEETAQTLLKRLATMYQPERVSLFLDDHRSGRIQETASVCQQEFTRPVFEVAKQSMLVEALDRLRRPVFVEDLVDLHSEASKDTESDSALFLSRLDAELLVPLVTGNELSGFLALGPKLSGSLYTQDDLTNLRLLSIQSAALFESRRLYQESLARRQLETELGVAQEIQAHLLPTETMALNDIQICGRMDSCREVGGDYFDYFPLDDQTIGLAIADVAGKGIPAALLMTTLRVTFHSEAIRQRRPERVAGILNQAMCELSSQGQFVCFFYGTYSFEDHCLSYCNAGMEPPILFRGNSSRRETLSKGGPVLGVDPNRHYRSGTLKLNPGDLMVCFSDGLTEETNAAGDFFDNDRLVATVQGGRNLPLEQLRESIFTTVTQFGGNKQSDDRTVVLLRILPGKAESIL